MSDRARAGSDPDNRKGSRAATKTRGVDRRTIDRSGTAPSSIGGGALLLAGSRRSDERPRLISLPVVLGLVGSGRGGTPVGTVRDQDSAGCRLPPLAANYRAGDQAERYLKEGDSATRGEQRPDERQAVRATEYGHTAAGNSRQRFTPRPGQNSVRAMSCGRFLSLSTDAATRFAPAAVPLWIRQAVTAAASRRFDRALEHLPGPQSTPSGFSGGKPAKPHQAPRV